MVLIELFSSLFQGVVSPLVETKEEEKSKELLKSTPQSKYWMRTVFQGEEKVREAKSLIALKEKKNRINLKSNYDKLKEKYMDLLSKSVVGIELPPREMQSLRLLQNIEREYKTLDAAMERITFPVVLDVEHMFEELLLVDYLTAFNEVKLDFDPENPNEKTRDDLKKFQEYLHKIFTSRPYLKPQYWPLYQKVAKKLKWKVESIYPVGVEVYTRQPSILQMHILLQLADLGDSAVDNFPAGEIIALLNEIELEST